MSVRPSEYIPHMQVCTPPVCTPYHLSHLASCNTAKGNLMNIKCVSLSDFNSGPTRDGALSRLLDTSEVHCSGKSNHRQKLPFFELLDTKGIQSKPKTFLIHLRKSMKSQPCHSRKYIAYTNIPNRTATSVQKHKDLPRKERTTWISTRRIIS